PLDAMRRIGAESSLLRSHVWSPGNDGAWGANGDDNSDLVLDDASEAGFGNDELLLNTTGADVILRDGRVIDSGAAYPVTAATVGTDLNDETNQSITLPLRVPLFSAGIREPGLDADRNSAVRYGPLTRLSNLVTTRSGVFAVWVTVGFFEVSPAPAWLNADGSNNMDVQTQFGNNRDLYDRVYPDGYQLGAELGSETGDTKRFKSFYMIDRTLPVGFRPGDDTNVERAILLQRRIE
ncbi:MAG: hypothetical protein AAGG46_11370, partial [Planctomycetota bacterium]